MAGAVRHRGSQVAAGARVVLGEEGRGTFGGGSTLGGLRTPQRGGDAHAEQGMKKRGPWLFHPEGSLCLPGFATINNWGWGLEARARVLCGGGDQESFRFSGLALPGLAAGRCGGTPGSRRC